VADETWGFGPERIHPAPELGRYLRFRGRRLYSPQVSGPILRRLLGNGLPAIQRGDVVWVHGEPALAEAVASRVTQAGGKLIVHLHSSAFATHSKSTLARLMKSAARIVFCSRFLAAEAQARFPGLAQAEVLYNGADEKLFFASPEREASRGHAVVLYASRLVPEKGAHVLLDAMRLLQRRGVPVRAEIAGASDFGGSAVTQYVRRLQRSAPLNVEFCGYESGAVLAARFRGADIFCLPATCNDPFPLAILEAMGSGLPVVASQVSGGGGVMVPPNDPAALANALEQLVCDPGRRASLAREAKSIFAERFSWRTVQQSYRHLLSTL
jgi:spore coat protein SA